MKTEAENNQCGNCRFFFQDKNSASCCNKNSDAYMSYRYYNFCCDRHTTGTKIGDDGMNELGYEKKRNVLAGKDGSDLSYDYFELKNETP